MARCRCYGNQIRPKDSPKTSLLDGSVRLELDDHEVGGGLVDEPGGAGLGAPGQRDEGDRRVLGPAPGEDLDRVEMFLGLEIVELDDDVVAERSLQGPLAVGARVVLLGVVGALQGVCGGRHVEGALLRTAHLVGHVAAVVVAVAEEGLQFATHS